MSEHLPARTDIPTGAGQPNKRPKLGEWYWVTCEQWVEPTHWINGRAVKGKSKKNVEVLMCVWHLASNHVEFQVHDHDDRGTRGELIKNRDLLSKTRLEPNWKAIIQQRVEIKQVELHEAVKLMADQVRNAGLLPNELPEVAPTLLPSVVRADPNESKKRLQKLKEKQFPAAQKHVEQITKELVALQKDTMLPMLAEGERMETAVKGVEERMFVLELYAGLCEHAIQIREGQPAAMDESLAIRQMLRYMDEETLIDYDGGGMDYKKIGAFDKWVARDENLNRMMPDKRGIVAFQVRRHDKEYPLPTKFGDWIELEYAHRQNKRTYLLIRNGDNVWRLLADIDFSPRLLPLRTEFNQAFTRTRHGWMGEPDTYEDVTPDDFDYDIKIEERRRTIFAYNRVLFFVQGLLDRSKVFSPHPPMNLADENVVRERLKLIFDEEIGLPSAHPPNWLEYRDKANATISKGSLVWCADGDELREFSNWRGTWTRPKYGHWAARRPLVCAVDSVSRNRKTVVLKWELGHKIKDEWVLDKSRPVPNKPHFFYQKKIEHDLGMRYGHQRVKMEDVFAVEAYPPGDFKRFLCDAYLKGAYLMWAPQLLGAEKWHIERKKQQEGKKRDE